MGNGEKPDERNPLKIVRGEQWAGTAEDSAALLVEVFRLDEPLGDFIKRLGEDMSHVA